MFIRLYIFQRQLQTNWQKALDADLNAVQQIIFTGAVKTNAIIYYILEQSKETILEFYKGTAKDL